MNDEQLIEQYFCHELTAAERAAFEQRLAVDGEFRHKVEAFEKTIRLVHLDGRRALRARLAERGRQLDAEKKRPTFSNRWAWALAALAAAAFFIWLFDNNQSAARHPAPGNTARQDSLKLNAPTLPDTASQQDLPPAAEKTPPAAAEQKAEEGKQAKTDRLFTAFFKPYKDDSLEPSVRGESEVTPEEAFLQYYWEGKYRAAISAFEKLEPVSKNKGDLQFLLANCLMATGKAKAAIGVLGNLGSSRFQQEAEWLLALAFLKNGDQVRARMKLQEIAGKTDTPKKGEAERLLRELD